MALPSLGASLSRSPLRGAFRLVAWGDVTRSDAQRRRPPNRDALRRATKREFSHFRLWSRPTTPTDHEAELQPIAKTCLVSGCSRPVRSNGICEAHRSQARRAGLKPSTTPPETLGRLEVAPDPAHVRVAALLRPLEPTKTPDVPTYSAVVKAARSWSLRAVQILGEIASDPEQRGADRVKAAAELLDRALGKAPQHLDVSTDLPAKLLTDDALRAAAAEILARVPQGALIEAQRVEPTAERPAIDAEMVPPSAETDGAVR